MLWLTYLERFICLAHCVELPLLLPTVLVACQSKIRHVHLHVCRVCSRFIYAIEDQTCAPASDCLQPFSLAPT